MAIKLKEKPIFIIGYERSGTTLLMAMLGCHPRIAIPEVGWLFPRIYPWRYTYGDLSIDSNFRIMAAEMLFGLNQPLWGMSLNPMTAVDEIISMVTERSFAGIYTTMHLRYAKEFGNKPRWGQKTPNNLYFVPQILDNFPNAQFIFITRDGRDACATSVESAFGAGNIYGAAYTWNAANTFVKPFREKYDSSTWLDVKYEELVRETVKTLKKICEFIGEQYAPEMLEFYRTSTGVARGKQRDHAPLGHAVSDRYVGIYKHLLSIRDQQIYAAVAGETHREAGYELDVEPIELSEAEKALKKICEFIGEQYAPEMLEFYRTSTGVARGKQRDHAPLGHAVSDRYVGIYKHLLSIRDQQIYAAVAGETHREAGYELDVEPIELSEAEKALWWEWDGRSRAVRLDGPGGHIVFESYRDWLVEQRLVRKQKGIWSDKDITNEFPAGHPDEEVIVGFRAWKKWKEHFSIKRQYVKG